MSDPIHPTAAKNALDSLAAHPGWELYKARVDELVKLEIEAKIFDPKTSDQERRDLVNARLLLVNGYAPEKIRQSLYAKFKTEVIKQNAAK